MCWTALLLGLQVLSAIVFPQAGLATEGADVLCATCLLDVVLLYESIRSESFGVKDFRFVC